MNTNKEIEELGKQIHFKTLPFEKEGVYNRLRSGLDLGIIKKQLKLWKTISVAASVTLVIVSSLYLIEKLNPPTLAWLETVAIPNAKTKVTLADGSTVWLNENASLQYPQVFNDKERRVTISGEGFFDIKKAEKPFIVELDEIKIKVLGTAFNVNTNKNPNEIIITLLEGKIALFERSNTTETPNKVLKVGEQFVYTKSSKKGTTATVQGETITSWATGQFKFNDKTLKEITNELERAFFIKIHIEDKKLASERFNAEFLKQETLDEILSVLQISGGFTIKKQQGQIHIN